MCMYMEPIAGQHSTLHWRVTSKTGPAVSIRCTSFLARASVFPAAGRSRWRAACCVVRRCLGSHCRTRRPRSPTRPPLRSRQARRRLGSPARCHDTATSQQSPSAARALCRRAPAALPQSATLTLTITITLTLTTTLTVKRRLTGIANRASRPLWPSHISYLQTRATFKSFKTRARDAGRGHTYTHPQPALSRREACPPPPCSTRARRSAACRRSSRACKCTARA